MVNVDSPILNFYPNTFLTDLNGKQHDWEAVVLVPFIDEVRTITSLSVYMCSKLCFNNYIVDWKMFPVFFSTRMLQTVKLLYQKFITQQITKAVKIITVHCCMP